MYGAGFMRGRRGFHFVDVAGTPKPYMGTQVFIRDVHNVDVAGFLFCGRRGRLTPVMFRTHPIDDGTEM